MRGISFFVWKNLGRPGVIRNAHCKPNAVRLGRKQKCRICAKQLEFGILLVQEHHQKPICKECRNQPKVNRWSLASVNGSARSRPVVVLGWTAYSEE